MARSKRRGGKSASKARSKSSTRTSASGARKAETATRRRGVAARGRATTESASRVIAELPASVRQALDRRVRAMVPAMPDVLDEPTQAELQARVMRRMPAGPDDPRYR